MIEINLWKIERKNKMLIEMIVPWEENIADAERQKKLYGRLEEE